jgi:hypothetical protein
MYKVYEVTEEGLNFISMSTALNGFSAICEVTGDCNKKNYKAVYIPIKPLILSQLEMIYNALNKSKGKVNYEYIK